MMSPNGKQINLVVIVMSDDRERSIDTCQSRVRNRAKKRYITGKWGIVTNGNVKTKKHSSCPKTRFQPSMLHM
jgi:hypothetical protein